MSASYSQIRDAAFDAIASAMTKTPVGSEASHKQLGELRRTIVGLAAEAVADEIVKLNEHPDTYERPFDRYEPDSRDYSDPGTYDTDRGPPSSGSKSSTKSDGGGLFQ